MLKFILYFFFFPVQTDTQLEGKVKLDRFISMPDDPTKTIKVSSIVWYSGNVSIQEVHTINSNTDSAGSNVTTTYRNALLFIDPNSEYYAYYGNFSDTSKLIKSSRTDNLFNEYGGWNLYSNKKFQFDYSLKLPDTIMNNTKYTRYRYHKLINGKKNDYIIYASCKNKDVPIKYLKPFSDEIGCPITIMETYYEGQLEGRTQLVYLTNSLTEQEKKVFQAWQKRKKILLNIKK